MTTTLISVNTARIAPLHVNGKLTQSAILKRSRSGSVVVGELGLEGDEQADPRYHGGPAETHGQRLPLRGSAKNAHRRQAAARISARAVKGPGSGHGVGSP